jgi:transcriptional regulator with XRE-family HTH domain
MTDYDAKFQSDLGEVIRSKRMEKGLSQREMAEKLGVPLVSYAYYEAGKIPLDVITLKKIAETLGIKPSQLIDQEQFIA